MNKIGFINRISKLGPTEEETSFNSTKMFDYLAERLTKVCILYPGSPLLCENWTSHITWNFKAFLSTMTAFLVSPPPRSFLIHTQVCSACHIPRRVREILASPLVVRPHTHSNTCTQNVNTNIVVGTSFSAWLWRPGCVVVGVTVSHY